MTKAEKNILDLFKTTSQQVRAYKHFLKRNAINASKIHTLEDFQRIPLTDKKNYLSKYDLKDLFAGGNVPPMVYASSGSSGKPTFWFRGDEQEILGGKQHELILKDIFKIRKDESTLVVICFSMGVWIAGNYTLSAFRHVARNGYQVSVVTPGVEKEDILNVLKNLAPKFEKTILAGYPPFLMDVVNEARKRRIHLTDGIKVITAGDKFSEHWRTDFQKLLKIKNPFDSVISIYGSADAGLLGHETPLSIFIRRKSITDGPLYRSLFGTASILPALVQYDPKNIFFEEINNELVFTTKGGTPLIRYNIHDIGKVISYSEMCRILKERFLRKEAGYHGLSQWRLPFLVLGGRTDVAVTFYALNIFPEHIQAGIEDRHVAKFFSGNFFAFSRTTYHSRSQKLCVNIELAKHIRPTKKISELSSSAIVGHLLKMNIEFRKLYAVIGERALPNIHLFKFGDRRLRLQQKSGFLNINGKKPRMVTVE